MPYPNEHACRLRNPDDFQPDTFRRVSRESDGKRYDIIMGRLKGQDNMTEESYRYPKDIWSVDQARRHCEDHDGKSFEPAKEGEGRGNWGDSETAVGSHEWRAAIPAHHTDVVDEPWDGPANRARLRTDENASYYREAHAYQDADANPQTKQAWKFIHHRVSADGEIGPAVVTPCTEGIGTLNGGHGGTTIPDADREGVWRHLATHLRDAGREPPALRSATGMPAGHEKRQFPFVGVEVRETTKHWAVLEGHASVFNDEYVIWDLWREAVAPGAFRKTLQEQDIKAFFNHDPNIVLGSTRAGTLKLEEDGWGLHAIIYPPDNEWGRPVVDAVKRGEVTGMSIWFDAIKQEWIQAAGEEMPQRILREVRLYEAGPVVFPAAPATEITARSTMLANVAGTPALDRARQLAIAAEYGYKLTESDRNLIRSGLNELELMTTELRTLAGGEPAHDHSPLQNEPGYAHSLASYARELEILELTLRSGR